MVASERPGVPQAPAVAFLIHHHQDQARQDVHLKAVRKYGNGRRAASRRLCLRRVALVRHRWMGGIGLHCRSEQQ